MHKDAQPDTTMQHYAQGLITLHNHKGHTTVDSTEKDAQPRTTMHKATRLCTSTKKAMQPSTTMEQDAQPRTATRRDAH